MWSIGGAKRKSLNNRLESQLQLRSIGGAKRKSLAQARIAASTAKYRQEKFKEPDQQARTAASAAKFKEPDQQARTAASAAKYRAGQGRTEENKKKIKASQEAYMN